MNEKDTKNPRRRLRIKGNYNAKGAVEIMVYVSDEDYEKWLFGRKQYKKSRFRKSVKRTIKRTMKENPGWHGVVFFR